MTTQHALLQSVNNMQVDAQAALPVIPNNGNPMGANNMAPVGPQPAAQPAPQQQYAYPWLGPSQYMEAVRQRLATMGARPAAPMNLPVPAPPMQPQSIAPTQAAMPVLPRTNGY